MRMMGLFDAPAPLFAWLDALLATVAPPLLRLVLWAALAGLLSMLLYRALSPQRRIARGKTDLAAAQKALDTYDGNLRDAWPLMRHMLATALRQVGRTGGPALLASLPLVCMLAWLSTAYGYAYPQPGVSPRIDTEPAQLEAQWVDPRRTGAPVDEPPRILIAQEGRIVADVGLPAPVRVIHKRQWWNWLLGNPAGYLPGDAAVDHIRVELPHREFLAFGPGWVRGWELTFFIVLVAVSVAVKLLLRIE
jgi:hypothetical protein